MKTTPTPRLYKLVDYIYDTLGSDTVYTVYGRAPRNVQLKYPCVIIKEDNSKLKHADDKRYFNMKKYSLTVVTDDESDETYDFLEKELKYCRYENNFISNNLYHYKLTLYY